MIQKRQEPNETLVGYDEGQLAVLDMCAIFLAFA